MKINMSQLKFKPGRIALEQRIVQDKKGNFCVEEKLPISGTWWVLHLGGQGQAGLEDCQDWLAKQQEE